MNLNRQQRRKQARDFESAKTATGRNGTPDAVWSPFKEESQFSTTSMFSSGYFIGGGHRYFVNRAFEVATMPVDETDAGEPGWMRLSIARLDRKPDITWRDMQHIKDTLVGHGCEGMEIYPAHDRLIDIQNIYHLWVNTDPDYRICLGFHFGRGVAEDSAFFGRDRGCP